MGEELRAVPGAPTRDQPVRETSPAVVRRPPARTGIDGFFNDSILPWNWNWRGQPEPSRAEVIAPAAPMRVEPRAPVASTLGVVATEPLAAEVPVRPVGTGVKIGASGPRIASLQADLRRLGYFEARPGQPAPSVTQGTFDDTTYRAVLDFQRQAHNDRTFAPMPRDGELDQRTLDAITRAARAAETLIEPGLSDEQLGRPTLRAGPGTDADREHRTRAKDILRGLGYDVSEGADFDAGTMEAMRRFTETYQRHTGADLGDPEALGPRIGDALRNARRSAEGLQEPWRQNVEAAIAANPLGQRAIRADGPRQPGDEEVIREVQTRLMELGYTFTEGADPRSRVDNPADGKLGSMTEAAIADFQRLHNWMVRGAGMPANGQINAQTLAALRSPQAAEMFQRLPENLRGGLVVHGYNSGERFAMVVRSMGTSPDADTGRPRERFLETRAALTYTAMRLTNPDLPLPGSGFRSHHEQAGLRRSKGRMAAPAGYSNHQSGRAVDLPDYGTGTRRWVVANSRSFGLQQHRATGEEHHFDLVVTDLTARTRRALASYGFVDGGREPEPPRVVHNHGNGRTCQDCSRRPRPRPARS